MLKIGEKKCSVKCAAREESHRDFWTDYDFFLSHLFPLPDRITAQSKDGGIYCSLPPEGDGVALATILAMSATGNIMQPVYYN